MGPNVAAAAEHAAGWLGLLGLLHEQVAAMGTKKPASAVTVVIDSFSYVVRTRRTRGGGEGRASCCSRRMGVGAS